MSSDGKFDKSGDNTLQTLPDNFEPLLRATRSLQRHEQSKSSATEKPREPSISVEKPREPSISMESSVGLAPNFQKPTADIGKLIGPSTPVGNAITLSGVLGSLSTLNVFPENGKTNIVVGAALLATGSYMLLRIPDKKRPDFDPSGSIEVSHYALTGPLLASGLAFLLVGLMKLYA